MALVDIESTCGSTGNQVIAGWKTDILEYKTKLSQHDHISKCEAVVYLAVVSSMDCSGTYREHDVDS